MRWNSFRVRLTLWNVTVLALVLGGFGLALGLSIQTRMSRMIDRELAARAHRYASRAVPPVGERQAGRRSEGPAARTPAAAPAGRADAEGSGTGSVWPFDVEAERLAYFRRARFLLLKGVELVPAGTRPAWDLAAARLAVAGGERYSTVTLAGERVRVLSAAWRPDGRIVGVVQVARELGEYERLWNNQLRTLLALLPVALGIAGVGGLFLTDRALRPVRQVTQAAAQITGAELSRRLEVKGRDELAELAATFNGMIGRLENAFEQQRRFTADASHELRTPLTRLKVTTSMALAEEQSVEEYRTALRLADQAADAMRHLIDQLLLLARADAGQLQLARSRVEIGSVLRQAAAAFAGRESAPVDLDLPPERIEIEADEDHLCRVFVNLLENAIRHTPKDGRITLSARVAGDRLIVRVTDTGEGIPAEHLPHLGQRFYRVDAARGRKRGGSGLGLAISRQIVQAHGGRLSIDSTAGRGTVVQVILPRAAAPADRGAAPAR